MLAVTLKRTLVTKHANVYLHNEDFLFELCGRPLFNELNWGSKVNLSSFLRQNSMIYKIILDILLIQRRGTERMKSRIHRYTYFVNIFLKTSRKKLNTCQTCL